MELSPVGVGYLNLPLSINTSNSTAQKAASRSNSILNAYTYSNRSPIEVGRDYGSPLHLPRF